MPSFAAVSADLSCWNASATDLRFAAASAAGFGAAGLRCAAGTVVVVAVAGLARIGAARREPPRARVDAADADATGALRSREAERRVPLAEAEAEATWRGTSGALLPTVSGRSGVLPRACVGTRTPTGRPLATPGRGPIGAAPAGRPLLAEVSGTGARGLRAPGAVPLVSGTRAAPEGRIVPRRGASPTVPVEGAFERPVMGTGPAGICWRRAVGPSVPGTPPATG